MKFLHSYSIGRKKALYLSCTTLLLGNLASSVASNPYFYAVARLLVGTGVSAIIILSSVYPLELMTPKWRTLSGAAGPWGEGVMTLALLAYLCPSWRMLTVLTSIPMIFMYFTQSFLPESPRWLLLNGKVEKTKQVLRQIAKYNGTGPIKEHLIENLEGLVKAELDENNGPVVALREFCQNTKFVVKTIVFMGCWFACNLIYYGIGFNVKNLSGDPYLNVFYMALVETVGFRSAIFVSRWLGRKKSFIICTGITTFLMLTIVLMDAGINKIEYSEMRLTVLTFTGKMFIAASMAVIDCFTCESFPTVARSTGVGFANFAGSIGCILAPQMAFLGSSKLPHVYYAEPVALITRVDTKFWIFLSQITKLGLTSFLLLLPYFVQGLQCS